MSGNLQKLIESICEEFDGRVAEVGVASARLELAKAFAEYEASQLAEKGEKCRCNSETYEQCAFYDGNGGCVHAVRIA